MLLRRDGRKNRDGHASTLQDGTRQRRLHLTASYAACWSRRARTARPS